MTDATDPAILAHPGRYALAFTRDEGNNGAPVTVHAYRAQTYEEGGRVVVVQHGMLRNGDEYRDFWIEAADRHGLLILAPTFASEDYPEAEAYNNGGVIDREGSVTPRDGWAYEVPALVVSWLRAHGIATGEDVRLFGHSAGGQFAHRMLSLRGAGPFTGIVAGNPGWYSLPTLGKRFPEGLGGLDFDAAKLKALFAYPLTILAGEEDSDVADPHLPQNTEALAQGPHRFARAGNYFQSGREAAQREGLDFNWQLVPVPRIGHDGRAMSMVAASLWYHGSFPSDDTLRALAGERAG